MNLYILADSDDLEDLEQNISASINAWLPEHVDKISFVNDRMMPEGLTNKNPNQRARELGLVLNIKTKNELKEPLNFLYMVAKQNQCEFVVGIINHDGIKEDVCYFGNEEGRPDVHEVAMYLGL